MAQVIVGLIGPGKGPRVSVPKGQATAVIRGLSNGVVSVMHGEKDYFEVTQDGDYIIGVDVPWVEFENTGPAICKVKIDALSSD